MILLSPATECTCPVTICCAHGVSLLAALTILQKSETFEAFMEKCPTYSPSRVAGGQVIMWDNVFSWPARS